MLNIYVLMIYWVITITNSEQQITVVPEYTNSWAVIIKGGHTVAEDVALRYGFYNLGTVSYTINLTKYSWITVGC